MFKSMFHEIGNNIADVLLEKNNRYGNSALEPIKIFAKGENAGNSICVRIDDKLSRIKNSDKLRKNDVFDLIGYLILLCIDKTWTTFKEFID